MSDRKSINKLVRKMDTEAPSDINNIIQEMVGPSKFKAPDRLGGPRKTRSPEPKFTRKTINRYQPLVNQRDIQLELQRQKADKANVYKEEFIANSYIGRNRTPEEQIAFLNSIRKIGRDNEKFYQLLRRGQTDTPVKRSGQRRLNFDAPPIVDIEDIADKKKVFRRRMYEKRVPNA